jgi:hypothetical protein
VEADCFVHAEPGQNSAGFQQLDRAGCVVRSNGKNRLRIPTMPITHSDLMAITIPSDADHRRSEATLGISNHDEVIGISQ